MNTPPTPAPEPAPVYPADRLIVDHEVFEWADQRTYPPDEKGDIYATFSLSDPGTELDWRAHSPTRRLNRQIMLTTESGKQLYVYGDRIFDVEASKAQNKPVTVELPVDGELPNATIGEAWTTPLGTSEPIAKVEILAGKLDALEAHDVQFDFPYTHEPNEIAKAAAIFAPLQSSAYKISRSDLLKEGAFRKAGAAKEHAERIAQKTKAAAVIGKEITKNAVMVTADVTKEVVKTGATLTRFAMERSAEAVARFAKKTAGEYHDAQTEFALDIAQKYVRLGAFATMMSRDIADAREVLKVMKEEDDTYEDYDPDNARDITRRTTHRALLRLAAARIAKDSIKQSIANKKA